VFNSLPFIAVGAVIAWRVSAPAWLAFFASMATHCLTDLPVHREDAHGHFLPLTSWRFVSPVSHWDPQHYGLIMTVAEVLLVVLGSAVLMRYYQPRAWSVIGGILLAIYLIPLAVGVTYLILG